jgi:transposase
MNVKIELPLDEIIKDYQRGMSLRTLEVKYCVSREVIRKRLKEKSISKNTTQFLYEVNQALFTSTNKKEIANKVGCSVATVYNAIKKGGSHESI